MTGLPPETHILVVDDDDRIRSLLSRFLRERGFRVSAAPNADKALSMAFSAPDLPAPPSLEPFAG